MQISFWHNTIWYLALLATSIASLTVFFIKTKNRRWTLTFWLSVLGLTYCIECMLLVIFNAYMYYPGIVSDTFQDAMLGNLFSQISVSSTAVLYCVLRLKKYWIPVFAAAYFLIDALFVNLGIYEHYWYKSVYTLIGFALYCWFVSKWYDIMSGSPKVWMKYVTLFLAVFAAACKSLMTSLKLLGIQTLNIGIYSDLSRDHIVGVAIYGSLLIILMILLQELKKPLFIRGAALAVLFSVQWLLFDTGVLLVSPGLFVPVALIDIAGYYLWTLFLSRPLNRI